MGEKIQASWYKIKKEWNWYKNYIKIMEKRKIKKVEKTKIKKNIFFFHYPVYQNILYGPGKNQC